MSIVAGIPAVVWLIWRAAKPFMFCRDVEAGAVSKDVLLHILMESAIYVAIPLFLISEQNRKGIIIAACGGMFLIGISGIIRTAIAYGRMNKASNKQLQAIDAKASKPDP